MIKITPVFFSIPSYSCHILHKRVCDNIYLNSFLFDLIGYSFFNFLAASLLLDVRYYFCAVLKKDNTEAEIIKYIIYGTKPSSTIGVQVTP